MTDPQRTFLLMSEAWIARSIWGENSKFLEEIDRVEPLAFNEGLLIPLLTGFEHPQEYQALVQLDNLQRLAETGASAPEILARMARTISAARKPPLHLPRAWSEFHHRNRVAFFALQREYGNQRWACEIIEGMRLIFFYSITEKVELLAELAPEYLSDDFVVTLHNARSAAPASPEVAQSSTIDQRVQLNAIGAGAISSSLRYEQWLKRLNAEQLDIVNAPDSDSIRIVGPAGSGKTISLCLRATRIVDSSSFAESPKKFLFVTHSWAMAERIDTAIAHLRGTSDWPRNFSVLPLLTAIQLHTQNSGIKMGEVLGEDTDEGRRKSIQLIETILNDANRGLCKGLPGVSSLVTIGLAKGDESTERIDLVLSLYEEIATVLSPQGVFPGDSDSIEKYLTDVRDERMPPFLGVDDKLFVMRVYERFLSSLVAGSLVTTDQFVLDAIRVFETFGWNIRRATEGYDYIYVDELQLFDAHERAALSLLARNRILASFCSAEDPNQGVYAPIYDSRSRSKAEVRRLTSLHRFNNGAIHELIRYFYKRFPLNTDSIEIEAASSRSADRPVVECVSMPSIGTTASEIVDEFLLDLQPDQQVAVVTIGDVTNEIERGFSETGVRFKRLNSYDDVETLKYSRKSVVLAPWHLISGTQYSKVLVVSGKPSGRSGLFWKLREQLAMYVAASRAVDELRFLCQGEVGEALREAGADGLVSIIS